MTRSSNDNHDRRDSGDDEHDDVVAQRQLDEHIAALRDAPGGGDPAAAGPPPETVAATLAMLGDRRGPDQPHRAFADSGRRHRGFMKRLVHMTFAQRLAAAVLMTVGILTLYVMFTLFSSFGTSVAFADVAGKLSGARTLSYTSTATMPGQAQPLVTKTVAAEPDRMRTEMPDGTVSIMRGHTTLTLSPAGKTAVRTELSFPASKPAQPADGGPGGIVQALRGLGGGSGEPLGEQVIGGVAVTGFRSRVGGQFMTVWADKRTAVPVRVETRMPSAFGEAVIVMDDFKLDPPVDDKLFSLDVPEGYTLKTHKLDVPQTTSPEQAVANLLRMYADRHGGDFPDRVDDWQAFFRMQQKPDGDGDAAMKFATTLGTAMGNLFGLAQGYGYAGKDVKIGDKEKVVFWYQPKPDSPEFIVLFGDLSTGKLTKEKLPQAAPARPEGK